MLQRSIHSSYSSVQPGVDRTQGLAPLANNLLKACRCESAWALDRCIGSNSFRGSWNRTRARAAADEPRVNCASPEAPSCVPLEAVSAAPYQNWEDLAPSPERASPLSAGKASVPSDSPHAPSLRSGSPGGEATRPIAASQWRPSMATPLKDKVQRTGGRNTGRMENHNSELPAPRSGDGADSDSVSDAAGARLGAASSDSADDSGSTPTSTWGMKHKRRFKAADPGGASTRVAASVRSASPSASAGQSNSDRSVEVGRSGRDSAATAAAAAGGGRVDDGLGLDPAVGDPGNPPLEQSPSGLDGLVASALAFDEEAFQSTNWGDPDWDLAGPSGPQESDAAGSSRDGSGGGGGSTTENVATTSTTGSGMNTPTYRSVDRRRRRGGIGWRGKGGMDLSGFDDLGGWDYGGYLDEGEGGTAAAAADWGYLGKYQGPPDALEARRGPSEQSPVAGANSGDLRTQRWDRGGAAGGRNRGGARRGADWGADAEAEPWAGVRAKGRSWTKPSEGDGGLDVADWGFDMGPGDEGAVRSGDGAGGGGGKRMAIRSESEMRKATAAVSTRLSRIGLTVTFPLPTVSRGGASPVEDAAPAAPAADAEAIASAESAAPAAASAAAVSPRPPAAGLDLRPEGVAEASLRVADASHSSATAAAAATVPKARRDWASVPLLYNFGPVFKLLEGGAAPVPVPLPEDLVLMAGAVPNGGGSGAGGRGALDSVLSGCTAYMIAGQYQILLVQDARSLEPAIAWLRASLADDQVVGIDAEWPPVFKQGIPQQLAMLQIASPSRVLLLHVACMKRKVTAPGGPIHELLSDPTLTWVACGWAANDASIMATACGGTSVPEQVVDVQVAARAAGWPRIGLLGLVTELLGISEFQKPRKLSMCNWAALEVSERQVRYAAIDALLPPLLLRQLRLFAAMPALRCSFCKQAMHAPEGAQQCRPALLPASAGQRDAPTPMSDPNIVCEHCGRSFWRSDRSSPAAAAGPATTAAKAAAPAVTGEAATEALAPAEAEAATAAAVIEPFRDGALGSGGLEASAGRPASKSKSLRAFLQSVVESRQRPQPLGPPVRRPRQRLFQLYPLSVSAVDASLDYQHGSDSESDNGSVVAGAEGSRDSKGQPTGPKGPPGAKGKNKRKKQRSQAGPAAAGSNGAAPASSRQQALWDAFEQASPAAAAAVAMAMAGQEDRLAEAAAAARGAQDGSEAAS